jgi:hypothetical protein
MLVLPLRLVILVTGQADLDLEGDRHSMRLSPQQVLCMSR